jgi:hypothetical protein
MGVFSLTNTATRVDQAVSAVHSGLFPNGTGIVYSAGAQTVSGAKTFSGNLISRAGFDASGNVSGKLSPHNDGLVDLGAASNRFGTLYATGITGTDAVFGGSVTVVGTLNANLNIGATGLASITVTGTGFFQNARVTGATVLGGATTISGNIGSSGTNTFSGPNTFQNTGTFQNSVFFESGVTTSGVSTVRGAATFHSSVAITGGALTHNGTASLTGTLSHTGDFFQGGPTSLTGNLSVNGNSTFTGNVTVANGTTTIRSSTNFTTGASEGDRLTINQNVDHTGDYNLTGSLRVSSNIFVTGTANVDGVLSVSSTGYFEGVRVTGATNFSGTNTLTGNNALLGNTFITGNETHSGNVTFNNNTGQLVQFNGYVRPRVVAQGFGTADVGTLTETSFWGAGTSVPTALGRAVTLTVYTGSIGEVGLWITGSSDTVAKNNDYPLGTYGRVFQLINVGTFSGSGVWYPLGI